MFKTQFHTIKKNRMCNDDHMCFSSNINDSSLIFLWRRIFSSAAVDFENWLCFSPHTSLTLSFSRLLPTLCHLCTETMVDFIKKKKQAANVVVPNNETLCRKMLNYNSHCDWIWSLKQRRNRKTDEQLNSDWNLNVSDEMSIAFQTVKQFLNNNY